MLMLEETDAGALVGAVASREAGVPRAWMRLPSGKRLDLLNPRPDAWDDEDLAIRLSRTYRWGGESSWPLPLSVAQHSLFVLELRRSLSSQALSADEELLELLHDGEEGFLGFDCISPLKAVLGTAFAAVQDRLMSMIGHRYKLPAWTVEGHQLHKEADRIAAASEAIYCVGWTPAEVAEVLGIDAEICSFDLLAFRYGDLAWKPWPIDVAAERFLFTLRELLTRRSIEQGSVR